MKLSKSYYLAYGSNLSVDQMRYRCPDAKIAGKAALQDWKLVFRFHATVEPDAGSVVPVLVWEISGQDEESLDCYEGTPSYYRKEYLDVVMTDLDGQNPQEVTAMIYVMNPGRLLCSPSSSYELVLREGYGHFGFDPRILHDALLEAKGVPYENA